MRLRCWRDLSGNATRRLLSITCRRPRMAQSKLASNHVTVRRCRDEALAAQRRNFRNPHSSKRCRLLKLRCFFLESGSGGSSGAVGALLSGLACGGIGIWIPACAERAGAGAGMSGAERVAAGTACSCQTPLEVVLRICSSNTCMLRWWDWSNCCCWTNHACSCAIRGSVCEDSTRSSCL